MVTGANITVVDQIILRALGTGPRSCGQIAAATQYNLATVQQSMFRLAARHRVHTAGRGDGPTRPFLWTLTR